MQQLRDTWASQRQRLSDSTWPAVELDLQNDGDVVHEDKQRLGHPDCVGKLYQAAGIQATGHYRFGHLMASVCCRLVHLSRVLARESTVAMGSPASIRIDDDLTTREFCITIGPSTTNLPDGLM